ncbi:MAG: C40 family peptidase [Rhodobacter sp.]|nr:C40 family peptidase [Rhodobacter sp.]
MSDRRLTPCNGRVAANSLKGLAAADAFVDGWPLRVIAPIADLCRSPGGARDRQLLMGDAVTVYEERDSHSFVQAEKDGYVGYVDSAALGERPAPTHWVAVPGGHVYARADMKSPDIAALVFGNAVTCVAHVPRFHETAMGGYIPKPQLWPIDKRFADPVTVAQMHFGVPYLWGGNSMHGIDCSGLVQASLLACGIACPGDSDMQEAALGVALGDNSALRRGDLLFWNGHEAMMVDHETVIHANAHHMAVTYESLDAATRRIKAVGDGLPRARRLLQKAD